MADVVLVGHTCLFFAFDVTLLALSGYLPLFRSRTLLGLLGRIS